jgi:hypothetical protein
MRWMRLSRIASERLLSKIGTSSYDCYGCGGQVPSGTMLQALQVWPRGAVHLLRVSTRTRGANIGHPFLNAANASQQGLSGMKLRRSNSGSQRKPQTCGGAFRRWAPGPAKAGRRPALARQIRQLPFERNGVYPPRIALAICLALGYIAVQ